MSDEDIQNLSQLQLLESLDLGHRKVKKEESKVDDFEDVINNLLSKVDNRIDNFKNISNVGISIKPFDIDINSNSEHNSSKINETKNSKNNKNSNSKNTLRNNFSNINSKNYLEDLNNNNIPSISNNFNNNNIPKASINLINSQKSEKNNDLFTSNNNFNLFEENKNNNENDNNFLKNAKNKDIIIENDNNPNNNQEEFILDDIPEIDQQTNEDKAFNNNNNNDNNNKYNDSNNNIKISQNDQRKSNGNMKEDENFKLDANEIELEESSMIDKEEENRKLLEEERVRKEKEEEEERIRKEKEEEEERLMKEKEEEERLRKEKEEEERLRKEKEEEERLNNVKKKDEENNQIEIEIVDDSNKSNDNSLGNEKKEDNNLEENNKEKNNEYQAKEKREQKQDDMDLDIDEIEIKSVNSVNNNEDEKKSEKQKNILGQKNKDENDEKYKIEVIKESKMSLDSKKSDDKKSKEEDEDKKSEKKDDKITEKNEDEISEKNEDEIKDKKAEKQKDIKLKGSKNKDIDMRNNSMPQNKNYKAHPVKKELRRSLTQKCALIKTFITKTIDKSEESQIDVSKIKDFETLKDLVQDEVALNELIPDFKEKILDKESEDDINSREFYITKEKYINNNIKECEELSLYAADYEEFHTDLMKNIYEENNLANLPKYENNFEEVIFHESKIDLMNCPIAGVENIESFIQKYFFNNDEKLVKFCNNSFIKWRRILGDGNSFYRILMFSMFEVYILTSNENELNYLIAEIISNEFIEIYKKKNIDYNTCFILLSAILDLVKEKNISKAYEILLKAYTLKNKSFDEMFIVYIKHVVATYIDKLKQIIDKKHMNTSINSLNSYMIESPNIEPSMLIICVIPYLYNISMTILLLNGDLLKANHNNINLIDPDEKGIPVINFGYFFSSYYKLYSPDFEDKYNFELKLMENNGKQLTYIFKEERPCEKCVKKTTHILFVEKKIIICKNCLEDHLSYACNFRADAFKKNGFIGLEYYTRPIHLCNNYYINDLEVIELLESFNLLSALCQKYNEQMCDNCKVKKENTENLFDLKCGCCFCEECIESIMLKITNGIKVLNPLEKKNIKENEYKCICDNQLDLDTILKHIKYNQNDEKEASERLKTYINTLCMICTCQLREQDSINEKKYINNKTKFKTIKLKKNIRNERANGIEYMEIEHLICEKCYLKHLKNQKFEAEEEEGEEEEDENEEGDKKVIDLETGKIFCGICCRSHELDPKFMNEGGCCSGGCITF